MLKVRLAYRILRIGLRLRQNVSSQELGFGNRAIGPVAEIQDQCEECLYNEPLWNFAEQGPLSSSLQS